MALMPLVIKWKPAQSFILQLVCLRHVQHYQNLFKVGNFDISETSVLIISQNQ